MSEHSLPVDIDFDDLPIENKAYAIESMRRNEAFSELYPRIKDAALHITEAIAALRETNVGRGRHRSTSITITKLEEAALWLSSIVYVTAPHGPEFDKQNSEAIDLHLDRILFS